VKKSGPSLFALVLVAASALMQAGCQSGPGITIITPAELAAAQERASKSGRPLIVLVAESGKSQADDDARAAFDSRAVQKERRAALATLDPGISRARATAAEFYTLETPLLVCLSPGGLIVSRDQGTITASLVLERIRQAAEQWPELEVKFARLKESAANNKNDAAAQLKLADFLMERHNALEAIPVLTAVAHSEAVDTASRIRAWAELARAHIWIGEPEKARHEALDLIATLGAVTPEAHAAANVVLGAQDATNAKRLARARREFEEAISAAPDSAYGKEAASALANLPKGGQ
jgi:tetratricopeptide (TPR) repeat protein